MAQTLCYFMSFSILGAALIVALWKAAQAIRGYQQRILTLSAQVVKLNKDIDEGIAYATDLLGELKEAQNLRHVSNEDLPAYVQKIVASRIAQVYCYGADPVEASKLASQVGGKCFRIMDAAKRNPSKIIEIASGGPAWALL